MPGPCRLYEKSKWVCKIQDTTSIEILLLVYWHGIQYLDSRRGSFVPLHCKAIMFATRHLVLRKRASWSATSVRTFAVKELPWCAPSDSPTKTKSLEEIIASRKDNNEIQRLTPLKRFGIVGAMSMNRIIGINGRLPWTIPEERDMFEHLTTGKILIVGRITFEEEDGLGHVAHTSHCIVVSKTLSEDQIKGKLEKAKLAPEIRVVSSFVMALDLARQLVNESEQDGESSQSHDDKIKCWVGGGEQIFDEALVHPSACQLNLSVIDMNVPLEGLDMDNVSRFPPKYRWDNKYKQVSAVEKSSDSSDYKFTHCVFERVKGSR